MNRKETTEFLGRLLKKERFGGIGKYWASEVSIGKRDFRMLRGKELQRGCIQWKRFEFPGGKRIT